MAGVQSALIRPAARFDTGAWDSRVGRGSAEPHKLGRMWFDSHTRNVRVNFVDGRVGKLAKPSV